MGNNPYLLAFLASLCFAVVVFPWRATAQDLGPAGVFLFTGTAYLLAGIAFWWFGGFPTTPTPRTLGLAVLTALIYVAALTFCSYSFANPTVNLSIAAAITAAYPAFTALIMVVGLGQRFTLRETVFFLMTVIGVVGLGLSSRN